jgi:hypothetical protein
MAPPKQLTATSLAGHVLASLVGLGALAGGIAAYVAELPGIMCATLLAAGTLLPLLAYFSLRGSRACWSFTIAITSVLGVLGTFGAPKERSLIGVPLAVIAVIPLVCIVAITLLSTLGPDYQGDGATSK